MATTTTATITGDWPDTPQFTATEETAVAVSNPSELGIRIVARLSESDTPPTDAPFMGITISPGETYAPTLESGERLWLCSPDLRAGSTDVPITH